MGKKEDGKKEQEVPVDAEGITGAETAQPLAKSVEGFLSDANAKQLNDKIQQVLKEEKIPVSMSLSLKIMHVVNLFCKNQ